MKNNKNKSEVEKNTTKSLIIIFLAFIVGGWNTCQAQVEKQYPQKIVLELELEEVIKLKIPKDIETPMTIEELNIIKQTYPSKGSIINLRKKSIIPEVETIIKEEDYDENNK